MMSSNCTFYKDKKFNDYCAEVMGYDNETLVDEDGDEYNPYLNLHQLAGVVEELIKLTGRYPEENPFYSDTSTWKIWHEYVVSTMNLEGKSVEGKNGNTPIKQLLAEYTAECCDFTNIAWVIKTASMYVDRMEDCQLRCLLHTLVEEIVEPNKK